MNNFKILRVFLSFLALSIVGCSSSGDDGNGGDNQVTSITLSIADTSVLEGDIMEFTVRTNTNSLVTAASSIEMDGIAINNNFTYAIEGVGTHTFVAKYNGLVSNSVSVTVDEAPTSFSKNVLIEDYTGAWCGWCPRVAYGIELVEQQTEQSVTVAIHRGNSSSSSAYYDPYTYPADDLEDMIGLSGYPTAMLNRTRLWTYPEPSNVNQVVNLTGDNALVGLALNPTINGSTMSIDVNVQFGIDYSGDNLKLVVYILEDGLYEDQVNYTSYYDGADPISNFEHNNVLRAVLTDILGDPIPNDQLAADNIYSETFNVDVPDTVSNSGNIRVVAFVVDNNNAAMNSRAANFGENQSFEITN